MTTPPTSTVPAVAVLLAVLPLWLLPAGGSAQEERSSEWDVTLARGETRTLQFTTDEGTSLSMDLSPDGNQVVFDLLGHIWRLPAGGGAAESLTQDSGVAVNYHPRFSPDGRHIAFISDRGGQNNLWIMEAGGANPRVVHADQGARMLTPAWTPDGQYIVVRREPLESGGGGGGGLWMLHRDGGPGVQILDDGSAHWPSVSPDGRWVYHHVRTGSDALSGDYQIRRLDLRTGEVEAITSGRSQGAAAGRASSGGAFAPEVSPDGRWLAFGRQLPDATVSFRGHEFGPRTALWLRDLESGEERILVDPVELAVESGSKSLRVLPGYAWSRDGESLILSQGGRVKRVDVATGDLEDIPFQAEVVRTISEMAYRPFRIEDGPFVSQFLRWPTASPDGNRLAFQAIGRIWVQDLPSGTPRRLTPAGFGAADPATGHAGLQEFSPTWSPDGRTLAFTTWDDLEGGHLWTVPSGGGNPRQVTTTAGEFTHLAWSPDGRELLAAQGAGATRRGGTVTQNPWWDVVRVAVADGAVTRVARVSSPVDSNPSGAARRSILQPSWGPEGRIFFPAFRRIGNESVTALVSVNRDGLDERTHLVIPDADEAVPSPDGRWVAFQEGDNVFVTAMAWNGTGGDTLAVDKRRGRFPVEALSLEGGLFPRWHDSVTVEFGSGNRYFTHRMDTETADTVTVTLEVPRRIPEGSVALENARIITLGADSVIERGTVMVTGARITCVGSCDVASADTVIDLAGRTLMPGIIDMHAHHYREHRGHRPLRDYEAAMYLAYGVTANLDNSMWSQNIFPTAELIEAGRAIGPRTWSTGDPLYRGDAARQNELSSREVTEQNIDRLQSWGAVSIKQYQQPRRDQRQWVSDVARDRGLMVTAESGDLFYNLGMVMDGQTAFEHPFSEVPIYGDVAKFLGRAGFYYSPTLVVAGPGPWNIEYWFAESDVWQDPKQRLWMPWRMNAGHLRRRVLRPDTDYSFPLLAEGMADIIAEGGFGAVGGHGEHHGLAAHWEIWMGATALGNYGALEVASLHGARFLGAQQDLGSIEVGKLADLLVLERNPLEDIRATADIEFVMKGGILYDGMTLDEHWPQQRPFGPHYWVDEDALRNDVRPIRE